MLKLFERYQFHFICCLVMGLCPCAFFVPRGAVIFLTLGGTLGWISDYISSFKLIKKPFILTFIGLIGWNIITALWAPNALETIILSLRLIGLLLLSVGWRCLIQSLSSFQMTVLKRYLFYGIIIAFILLFLDISMGNLWQDWVHKSSAKAFVPLVLTLSAAIWPCLDLFNGKFGVLGKYGLGSSILSILLFIDCDTSILAILGGGIIYHFYSFIPRLTVKVIKVSSITLMLGLPWIFSATLTPSTINQINHSIHSFSYIHRLYIWKFVSDKISDQWFKGYGGDSSRAELVGGEHQTWPMINKQGESILIESKSIPLHPHNISLQLWLELGIIGAILGAFLYYLILRNIQTYQLTQGASFISFFTAANTIFWINLGCWQSWWLATLAFLSAFLNSPSSNINRSTDQLSHFKKKI